MASRLVGVMGFFAILVAVIGLSVMAGIVQLGTAFSGSFGTGVGIAGVGFAIMALAYAMDSLDRLRKLAAGEVAQKVAMIYGYAFTMHNLRIEDAPSREYLTKRIEYDVKGMRSIGKFEPKAKESIEKASDVLLCEMLRQGFETKGIVEILGKMLYESPKKRRKESEFNAVRWGYGLGLLGFALLLVAVYVIFPRISPSGLDPTTLYYSVVGTGAAFIFAGFTILVTHSEMNKVERRLLAAMGKTNTEDT